MESTGLKLVVGEVGCAVLLRCGGEEQGEKQKGVEDRCHDLNNYI